MSLWLDNDHDMYQKIADNRTVQAFDDLVKDSMRNMWKMGSPVKMTSFDSTELWNHYNEEADANDEAWFEQNQLD